MNAVLTGLKALGPLRLGAMAAVALGVFALMGLLVMRGGTQPMALLYADLDLREAGQVVDQLERARIPREMQAGGSRILVPADQVARARLLLAKEGLPSGGSIGYEIFDRADGLTASGFQQGINQTRALEGELSRSIRMINGVRAVRVHLVLGRREPFARDKQDAQASVVLTMAGAGRLDREGTQAVLNLTAAAVPGLRPQNIAVVDSRGNVLARAGEPLGPTAAAQGADELRRSTELRLARAVEEMLERSVGAGRGRAEAAVEMDYDQIRETQERYDPDGQVVRSQQSNTNNSKTTEANQTVSVQNNLPNADAGQAGAGTQEQRQEETTNYEIGKTVRTLVREQPQLRRVSLAVMVDGVVERGADGAPAWRERTAEELARITALVRSAVGFNEQRGDKVEVVSMRFAGVDEPVEAARAGMFGLGLEKPDLLRLGESGLIAVVVVLGLLLVLRPLAIRLTKMDPVRVAGPGAGAGSGDAAMALAGGGGTRSAGAERDGDVAAIEDDSLISLANVEGAIRMSSLRRVMSLAEKHPEETVAVMRGWLAQEEMT